MEDKELEWSGEAFVCLRDGTPTTPMNHTCTQLSCQMDVPPRETRMRKSGLPPVVDENTEFLVLGTLPSDMSIAAGQYYANPRNDFWKLVGAALNQTLVGLPYGAKVDLLKANRIGLWDAYHSCIRPGSMDGGITGQ